MDVSEGRIHNLIEGHDVLATVIGAMLQARAALWTEFTRLHREMLKIAQADPVCRQLMSASTSVLWWLSIARPLTIRGGSPQSPRACASFPAFQCPPTAR